MNDSSSLVGCVTDIYVNELPVSFDSARRLNKVVANACPYN
jgi:hypothetical protein